MGLNYNLFMTIQKVLMFLNNIKSNIRDNVGLSEANIFLNGSNIVIITINGSDLPPFPHQY